MRRHLPSSPSLPTINLCSTACPCPCSLSAQVLSIVNQSIATAEDQHTQNVATTVLAAVVPAWSAAGKDLSALWTVIVDALPSIPAHRRLGLMNSLLFATNVEDSLPVGLLMLLRLVANAMGPQQEEQEQPEQQQKDKEKPEVWALELAAKMTLQVCGHLVHGGDRTSTLLALSRT